MNTKKKIYFQEEEFHPLLAIGVILILSFLVMAVEAF